MSPRLRQAKQQREQPASFKAEQTAFAFKAPRNGCPNFSLIRYSVAAFVKAPAAFCLKPFPASPWRRQPEQGALMAIIWTVTRLNKKTNLHRSSGMLQNTLQFLAGCFELVPGLVLLSLPFLPLRSLAQGSIKSLLLFSAPCYCSAQLSPSAVNYPLPALSYDRSPRGSAPWSYSRFGAM